MANYDSYPRRGESASPYKNTSSTRHNDSARAVYPSPRRPQMEEMGQQHNQPQQVTSPSQQREVGAIQQILSKLRENVRTMEYLVVRVKSITSSGEEATVRNQIDDYTVKSREKMEEARKRIKHLYPKGKKPKTPEQVMCKNQQLSLARQLFGIAQSFQAMQLNFKSDVMEKLKRQYKIVRPLAEDREIDDYLMNAAQYNQDHNNVFQQAAMSGRPQALYAFEEAKTQQANLQSLNQSIEEMLNIFQEMQILIDTQGEKIDEINVNSESTVVNMNGASTEMTKAIKSRIRARRRYRCIAIIIIIILIIVIGLGVAKATGHL